MNKTALLFIIFPPIAFVYCFVHFVPSHWSSLRMAGLVLSIVGIALVTLARIQLGNSFSLTPQARALVTRGIYSRVRHPVYVFGVIAVAGLFLYLNMPMMLLILVAIVPLQLLRARAEERVLEQRFGADYRQYRASTWL